MSEKNCNEINGSNFEDGQYGFNDGDQYSAKSKKAIDKMIEHSPEKTRDIIVRHLTAEDFKSVANQNSKRSLNQNGV